MATDNKRKLYDALSQDYDMGSYEQFCADLNDEGKRRKLYDATSQDYDLGTWDSFSQQLGYNDDASVSASASQTDTPPLSTSGVSTIRTPQVKMRMSHQINTMMNDFNRRSKARVDQTRRMAERFTPKGREKLKSAKFHAQLMGAPTRVMGITPTTNAPAPKERSGTKQQKVVHSVESPVPYDVKYIGDKPVTEWLLPDGNLTTSFAEADQAAYSARMTRLHYQFEKRMKQNGLDPTNRKDVQMQAVTEAIEKNERKIKAAKNKLAKKEYREPEEEESLLDMFIRTVGGAARQGSGGSYRVHVPAETMGAEYPNREISEEIKNLMAENMMLEEARQALIAGKELKKSEGKLNGFFDFYNNFKNFAAGVGHTLLSPHLYYSGITELHNSARLNGLNEKLQRGEGLTDSELSLAFAAMLNSDVKGSTDLPHAYTSGQITTEMIPFFIQIAMNPASGLSKALVKKYGKSRVKRLLFTAAGDIAESGVLTNTLQAGSTIADIQDRHRGELVLNNKGKYEFQGGEGWATAIRKGEGASIIENYTEKLGEHFGVIGKGIGKGISKAGKKIGAGNVVDYVTRMIDNIGTSDWGRAIGNIEKRAQFHGMFGEILEEEIGIPLNALLVGDNSLSDLVDAEQQIDIALGVSIFSAHVSALKAAGYPVGRIMANRNLKKVDIQGQNLYSLDEWEEIKSIIDDADDENLAKIVLSTAVSHGKRRPQHEKVVIKYADALMKARGYNLAQAKVEQEHLEGSDGLDPLEYELNNSYTYGYEIKGSRDKNDAQNLYAYHRQRVESIFDSDVLAQLDNNPVKTLRSLHDDGKYSQEEREAAYDYVNAKAVRDGLIQCVNDDIDEQIAQSDAMINARVNPASGMIQPAVMGVDDRQVYVVGGNLVINDDGTIDRDASDESIVVRDAVSGELEFTDPKSIVSVGEAIDPEIEKATASDTIRQQVSQGAADALNGVLPLNPGDVVPIIAGGSPTTFTIVGPAIDEQTQSPIPDTFVVEWQNGIQTSFTREQIQAYADEEAIARLNDFEQQRAAERERQRAAEAEAQRPQFALNDEFTILNDNGTPIRGSITAELDEDGTVEIHTEEPINGNHVNRFTPAELEEMFDTYNGQPVSMPEPATEATGIFSYGDDNWQDALPERSEEVAIKNSNVDEIIDLARKGDAAAIEELEKYGIEYGTAGVYRFVGKDELDALMSGKHYRGRFGNGLVDVTASDVVTSAARKDYRIKFKSGFDLYKTGNGRAKMKSAQEKDGYVLDGYDLRDVESIDELQEDGTYKTIYTDSTDSNAVKQQPSVLSRIPVDEQGQPKYEETDPDTAWDAIVEQAQGDEATAAEVVADIVAERQADFDVAEKELTKTKEDKPEKRKKGDPAPTVVERIAAKNAAKKALAKAQAIRDSTKAALDHWKSIAGTKQRREDERRSAEDAEARRRAAGRAAEEARLRAEREEAERIEREALNGVPDWNVDIPADARARGYRRNGPQKVDRPEIIDNHAIGNSVEVKFGDDVMPTGNIAIIEASQLQPSHRDGQRNPYHFLDEAQPKERKDAASRFAASKIAEAIRPEEITSSVTAFTGVPSVNSRGEVIQGNNRSEALRLMYESYADSAAKYKQYLLDHAAEFGLTPEAIEAFEQPVLVNMLDVSDENAITLGQYVAQDTESGGVERIKSKNVVQKMGNKIRNFANLLLRSADDEATFAQLVDANGVEVLKWMNQQGFITNTQYASAFDSRGNLTAEAANDLKGIMYQSIFTGGSTRLEEMFNKMPAKAQRAILATAFRDYDSAFADRMISEIQQSIIAFDALMGYEQFRDATNAESAQNAVEAWKLQFAFDDVSGEPYLPSETFSNFALALAAMYKGHTQRHIQSVFNMMYDIVQGTEQDNLFEAADKTPKPLAEAIRRVLNLEYQPIVKPTIDNGTNGSTVLDVDSEDGQDGRPGSSGNTDGAEQNPQAAEPSEGGTGTASDSGQGSEVGRPTFIDAIKALYEKGKDFAVKLYQRTFFDVVNTPDFMKELGLTGDKFTIRFGVISRHFGKDSDHKLPIDVWEQLPEAILTPFAITRHFERKGVKTEEKGYRIYTTLRHNGKYVIVGADVKVAGKGIEINAIETAFAITSPSELEQVLYTSKNITPDQQSLLDGRNSHQYPAEGELFGGKVNTLSSNKQGDSAESSNHDFEDLDDSALAERIDVADDDWTEGEGQTPTYKRTITIDGKHKVIQIDEPDGNGFYTGSRFEYQGEHFGSLTEVIELIDKHAQLAANIAAAEAEVNTDPTPGQIEAGNYKKGHVQVGTFDVTIEQPVGSVRHGTDADGKEWKTTMQDAYGYIRGTQGVDGDHIDVFLSTDIDAWNGRRVIIVDQYNPGADGSFDEHKVMLGFNDKADAINAYLANYEKGWEKGRRLVFSTATLEDFEKWIESSHRKQKPYHEYKIAEKAKVEESNPENTVSETEQERDPLFDEVRQWLGMKGLAADDSSRNAVMRYFKIGYVRAGKILNAIAEANAPQVTTEEAEQEAQADNTTSAYTITPTKYEGKHKTSDVWLVKFNRELTAEEKAAFDTFVRGQLTEGKKTTRGLYDRKQGGYMMRSEEVARQLGEMLGSEEAVADAQPLSLDDMRPASGTGMAQVDVEGLLTQLSETGEANLADHSTPVKPAAEEKPEEKPVNPSGNKLVTDEQYADYLARFKKKIGGQLNMGVDPEILQLGAMMAVYHIEKGARKFVAYVKAMYADLADMADKVPVQYLKGFYKNAHNILEVNAPEIAEELDSDEVVNKTDVAAIINGHTDAMAAAEAVVAEQEAEDEKAEAERKLQAYRHLVNKYAQDIANDMMFKKAVSLMDTVNVQVIGSELYNTLVGNDIATIATNDIYKMFVDQWNINNGTLQSAIIAEAIRKAHKAIRDEQTTVNPDGTTSQTVVEAGTEIEIASGDFIPGVRPTVNTEKKPGGKKKPGKAKPKPTTDGGLFDAVEDDTTTAPAITVPEQRPEAELMGDSAAYQERETQTVELVEEIGGVIESRVAMLQLDPESVKPLTMTDVKKMASKYPALKEISDTDLQELVELAMTQLTRSEAIVNIDGTAEQQRSAYDHIVNLYQIQPSLTARDSERLIKQQYSTPTPFGFVMGQFVRAGGKEVGSMLEPSAGNGALTITVHPSVIHVNDIDDARLANLRKLGYGQVTAQDALLPFSGDKVDVVMTNPPFGTVTEKVYDGVFRISSLEGQMAINALGKMKDDGRAAIVIGGTTSYRTNGSMNPKDAAFFGYLYSHYNVADVINISGKALYSRNGTGYDVRMILIDGRKTGEFQRVYPPVKAKARAEQVTTFDELYKRVQDDIQQIQQMGSQSANVQRDPETAADGTASAPVRSGNNRPNTGAGQRPGTTGDAVRDTPRTDSGQPTPANDGGRPVGVDNADGRNGTGSNDVPRPNRTEPGQREQHNSGNNERRGSGDDGRISTSSRPDRGTERLAVSPGLTEEKVPYPNQSGNGFTLLSVVPAAQAQVLQRSLGEIGDVDQYLVDELGYSSKEELYSYLAAEQIDSVALAIHQMNMGNAFIIGDMTGVGKGRQGAALIRYAVMQGKVPVYFTQKPTLFTDNYRDLSDIGSSDLRPFIIASDDSEHSPYVKDSKGNVVHKLPTKKERERVYNYIMEHGTLPDEYDYVITTYDQIRNGNLDYRSTEEGWVSEPKKYAKGKSVTATDRAGQIRRDVLAAISKGNYVILDESHTVGGDSASGRYMQMLTSQAEGVTFMSATFAKRADNMPIYAQRTAIAEAGVKASELIEAIMKGGVTLQEIMSKQLVESGQMIRRERSFDGVTIDWLSVEEETDRRQRQQFNEVAEIFNAIRNFQNDYIKPIISDMNDDAASTGGIVDVTRGTESMGVKNVPFASKMYNLVNQLLFALKVDAVADRVIENLRNGYKPVISFTNTMEGFLKQAEKGVPIDEVPNFSITLLRALDGVMRYTEKDADQNSEGGYISLSQLSSEGQNAYNAIREKIINLSADLPISPMDAIRMKIEEAGYSVAEITGRTMQLNRTDDGKYIVETRKDRDKDACVREFNSGKLDVLMINKSGSTGISLHSSSKFEDQRQRVMVFAQFQSDINDEVQMRGRIDRSGQVTHGRYEYIMSTIPAEQRIQMMFKAKLKSLDANTTSSQKSKFNEMEIVDYLNKYGDEVVWEYMKEHPELEERLGDPLKILKESNSDEAPKTSEKEDTKKKPGCAGLISRYLAFLSVEEQDEIFREITEAYRVKIQLLDDAGENDLEITTMPLRAETKRKQIWHEGENPGSGNAFADNTYVEEVEVDVLNKPMKRAEIEEATRKLVGEKGLATEYDQQRYGMKEGDINWTRYAETMQEEITQFFQTKADEAVAKLKEAGDARVAKAREKAVSAATKARSRAENNFSDEEIQSLADTVANEAREKETYKQRKRREEIMAVRDRIKSLFTNLRAGNIYVVPQDLKQATPEMFSQTFGTFVGFKFNKSYTLGSSTAIFATLDGRRKVELALSDPGLQTIIGATNIAYRYSPKEINAINVENWDSKVPTQTRQKRYIITGNLLQALVDTEKGEKTRGNLISYSTIDGETRQGILMGENFKLTDLRNSAPLSSRLAQIREGKAIVSENGDVQIKREMYDWRHRGEYELRVPKSKQRGGIYTMNPDLLKLVSGHNFITKGNNMVAYVAEADIAKVVDMLSRAPFNLTVLQESKLADVSADEAEDDVLCRPVTDKATLDRLNSEPTIKVYRAMQMIDGGLRPPMSAKVDGELREATEVGVWEEAEEHPEMADEKGRFKLDKGNGKSIKAAYNPYIHTSRSPINDQFSSAWSRPELVTVEVEVPASELTSEYHAEKAKDSVGEKEWRSGPVGRALAKIGQARKVILSRWSRIVRVVPVEEVAEAYAQRLNAHGIEVPFNTVPPALRDALAERGVKIGKPEKGNAGKASMPAFEQWIAEQERLRMGDGYGAYSDAEVSYLNDPASRILGKNRFSKKRQAEFAARERQRIAVRIGELADKLHLNNMEIVTDALQLEGKRAKAKGFYNKRTDKITIVIPNNVSIIDAEQTLLHEAVAHYGLRQLFGERFDTFLDNVYASADESIRRKIAEMAAQNGWDFRTATEEYLAGLAEETEFENVNASWWYRIKSLFLDMLESIGFEGFRDRSGVVLTDNELRYILWRSYENLAEPGRYRSILGEAADVAKQSELKVGNYAEQGVDAEYAAEPSLIGDKLVNNVKIEEGAAPTTREEALNLLSQMRQPFNNDDQEVDIYVSRTNARHSMSFRDDAQIKAIGGIGRIIKEAVKLGEVAPTEDEKDSTKKVHIYYCPVNISGVQYSARMVVKEYYQGDKVLDQLSLYNYQLREMASDAQSHSQMLPAHPSKAKNRYKVSELIHETQESDRKFLNEPEEELFRSGDFSPRDRAIARDAYNRVCASGGYQFQEAVQDSMLGLKELYKAILGKKTRIEDVAGFENAYLFENRMSSTNASEQHEYFIRYMNPLLQEIGRIAGANERKRRELTDYIMAKHGLERNERMRNEAAANGEDTDRDFAGLIGLTGEADWQAAEATARQWVDDYEAMYDTAALWEAINKATKATLEKVYLSGIISKDTYEKILGMYDYYVPLRGWNEKTSDEVYGYLTSKDGPLGGSIMKKAEGRESMADDPIATIGMMADDAIRQGNRNLMKQRFLNFILNHPSDAVSVHDLWLEYNDVTDEWVPVFADVEETDTADVVEQKVKDFEERMEALRTAEPDKYKRGREAQHIPYKVVRGNLREHQILIKRNGRTFVATINGNPRAAQAINGLTNPDVDQNGVVGNMLKAGTWVNRQLSAFYTTRNPDFVVGNFYRDMLYSNCMTWVKESPRYARRFHKNFGIANPVVMRRLLGKWEEGTLDRSNRLENLFYQFMKNGGETGYTNVRDIEGHKRAVAAELKKQGSTGRRVWTALGMQLDLLNRSAENCARFAAFVTSRDFGRNIDRAIYDAKEISVNFNKKGSGGKMVNATGQTKLGKTGAYLSGGGRLLYVFWNAGVQGMTNFGRQAKLHPAKFSVGATALFTLGYVIPMLAQMLGGGDGDDDDKNAYYNLPEYVRRSNICFYAGDQWITIPLPIEYRAMYGMGELAHGVISGNERYSNAELARQMASQVSQIFPIDMLEGGGGVSPFIPSAAKPFTEAYIMNKGWTGLPVYKDTPFNKNMPEWTKAYASADKHLVDFAKWLNETSGGDDFKKGSIDINPAKIEYLLNGTFGGLFTFPNKLKKSAETAFGDRDFEWRNMPIANRLIKSGDERTANRKLQNEYFKYKKEYEEIGERMRKYENADEQGVMGDAERIDLLENSPEYARWEIFDEFKADLDMYREEISAESDKGERERIEAEMYAVMRELVNALHDPEAYRNSEQE